MLKYIAETEKDTVEIATQFAKTLKVGDIVALYGTLGAGKTAFCRGFIQSLTGMDIEVPSPTFTLLQTYDTNMYPIYHFDMYRLKQPDEAYELGIEDAFTEGVSLIEWPEKLGHLLPKKHIRVTITILPDEKREIIID
ncbi:MAG: tRNA (adenosine(37)-N6)-threonylcarbamoyltransferase complex ATPase subunit type 1 TsaE [Alphaproteobacteria bacterium]|nr:tRNA (adenosine(37)-N6)-threonylcarbamoyltransferase complex ATPase subunit type 1 TsaE [Alphaproteobacteria bacterium]